MRSNQGQWGGFILIFVIAAGLGVIHPDPALGFDDPANDFDPFSGVSTPNPTANSYDFVGVMTGGECEQPFQADTDADGATPYQDGINEVWANVDKSCMELQDWDSDGICDHRVQEGDLIQGGQDFAPSLRRYFEVTTGIYAPAPPNPGLCTGWAPA